MATQCGWRFILSIFLGWLISLASYAGTGQTVQIYSQLDNIRGKPAWLLIFRDLETGTITPYLYDFVNHDDFWLAFTYADYYQITVSQLTFNPYNIHINNFCNLEKTYRKQESLYITLQGDLKPYSKTLTCNVLKFGDTNFTIANHQE